MHAPRNPGPLGNAHRPTAGEVLRIAGQEKFRRLEEGESHRSGLHRTSNVLGLGTCCHRAYDLTVSRLIRGPLALSDVHFRWCTGGGVDTRRERVLPWVGRVGGTTGSRPENRSRTVSVSQDAYHVDVLDLSARPLPCRGEALQPLLGNNALHEAPDPPRVGPGRTPLDVRSLVASGGHTTRPPCDDETPPGAVAIAVRAAGMTLAFAPAGHPRPIPGAAFGHAPC